MSNVRGVLQLEVQVLIHCPRSYFYSIGEIANDVLSKFILKSLDWHRASAWSQTSFSL